LLLPFAFSPFISFAIATSFKRYTATHQANSYLIRFSFHFQHQSKTCASPLCNLQRSFPCSTPLSLCFSLSISPFGANSRSSRAFRSTSVPTVSLHAHTLHFAISQPSWLHFVFPSLAQGCFPFLILIIPLRIERFDWAPHDEDAFKFLAV